MDKSLLFSDRLIEALLAFEVLRTERGLVSGLFASQESHTERPPLILVHAFSIIFQIRGLVTAQVQVSLY